MCWWMTEVNCCGNNHRHTDILQHVESTYCDSCTWFVSALLFVFYLEKISLKSFSSLAPPIFDFHEFTIDGGMAVFTISCFTNVWKFAKWRTKFSISTNFQIILFLLTNQKRCRFNELTKKWRVKIYGALGRDREQRISFENKRGEDFFVNNSGRRDFYRKKGGEYFLKKNS